MVPAAPCLEDLLGRAKRTPLPGDFLEVLFGLFRWERSPGADWPSGPVSRRGEGAIPDGAWWCHADPVHLRPDMERLMVVDARGTLGLEEADELVARVNAHFASDGWHLELGPKGGWYLRVDQVPRVATSPLLEVSGRSMYPFLPRGQDRTPWRRALNEVQMLLHQAPVNERRRALGQPTIDGLWFWGGGRIHDAKGPVGIGRVCADHPLARGLAVLANREVGPFPLRPEEFSGADGCLIVRDPLLVSLSRGDMPAWAQHLVDLDAWLRDLWSGLRNHGVDRLLVYPCDGHRYEVKTGWRWPFRRRVPLYRRMRQSSGDTGA
jgi:hypothetical protein